MRVEDVWRAQRQWSAVASGAASSLSRWRLANLSLLLLGSVLAALAAQQAWFQPVVTGTLGAMSAAALALAGVVQVSFLNAARMRERLMARSVSEGLKGLVFQYLAGVAPFASGDGETRLAVSVGEIDSLAGDRRGLVVGVQGDGAPLPEVRGIADYVRERAAAQRQWHENRTAQHRSLARRWRAAELAATAAAAVLAAVGDALSGFDLSSWVAVATTAAAAFAAHLASQQHDRVAESYARTVLLLDAVTRDFKPTSATPQQASQYVASVERILAAQNDAWVSLFRAT